MTDTSVASAAAARVGVLEKAISIEPGYGPGARGHTVIEDTQEYRLAFARVRVQQRRISVMLAVTMLLLLVNLVQRWPGDTAVSGAPFSGPLRVLDSEGGTRLYFGLHDGTPVLQLLGAGGTARLSLGLRFDETPFLDLADESGRTRISLQADSGGEPALRVLDEQGRPRVSLR